MSHGGDLHAKTAWGDTAIHYAAVSGTTEVLNYLLREGVTTEKDPQAANVLEPFRVKYGMSEVRRTIANEIG